MISRRVAVVALLAAACGLLAWKLYQQGPRSAWMPGCLLHKVSGLHCAGCGMTRAAHASLHGDFPAAFRLNSVGMILFPAVGIVGMIHLFFWMRGKSGPVLFPPSWHVGWWVLGVIFTFSILRNIPAWPFTLLAPH